jgi:DNA polymerase-3 subunit delta
MVKITPRQISEFFKTIPKEINSILFYGEDDGLVAERGKLFSSVIQNKYKNVSITRIDFNQLNNNYSQIYTLTSNLSFFAEFNLIIITDFGAKIPKELEGLLLHLGVNNFVVCLSKQLLPSSTTRKFFETNKKSACIACYEDDQNTVKLIISKKLANYGIRISPEAVNFLENTLKGDRKIILSELDKLITYAGRNASITFEQIKELCIGKFDLSFDNFTHAMANGSTDAINNFNILVEQGIPMVSIMRSLTNYYHRLYLVKKLVANGMERSNAIKQLSPPLFVMHVNIFSNHLNNFSVMELENIINILYDYEVTAKKNYKHIKQLSERVLLIILNKKYNFT